MKKGKLSTIIVGGVAAAIVIAAVALEMKDKTAEGGAGENVSEQPVSAQVAVDYFVGFRSERDSTRTLEIQYLNEVIASADDNDTLADAEAQKLALVESMEAELMIESRIIAGGFSDAAVMIHNGNVSVVVRADTLTNEDVAVILDIVLSETDAAAGDVRISNVQ